MRLTFRPADPNDVPGLVEIYDRAYQGGYSACFDRYGPATPQDFWWVQSEKSVAVVELNRRPAGLIIIGKVGRRLLAEEILLDALPDGSADSARRQVHDFLVDHFQRAHQDRLTVRCAETNALALALAEQYRLGFANALVVAVGAGALRGDRPAAQGYAMRRAVQGDARNLARLHEETLGIAIRQQDLESVLRHQDARIFLVERENYPVAFAVAQGKDGVGRWTIGVRDAHRRRGIGMALAREALQFLQARKLAPVTTYWAMDAAAAAFVRSLGGRTERTYLYFEREI